jgi:ceramide glucosyltransferase
MRTVRPAGYALSFVMYAIPMAILAAAVNEATVAWHAAAAGSLLIGLIPRIFLHYRVCAAYHPGTRARPWLVPVRDLLCFVVWATSFLGRAVRWRDQDMLVRADGVLASEKVRNS